MRSSVCVDASLIVRALVPGPLSDRAEARLALWRRDETWMIAPSFAAIEILSAFRRLEHFGHITPDRAVAAFEAFLDLDIHWSHRRDIVPVAWDLARRLHRPTAYDTSYLALATLAECEFWTADERLYNAVHAELPWVRWIGAER
jgi:predicted nucleic acid-binding protein